MLCAVNCFMYIYIGLSAVLGGVPSPWRGCISKEDPHEGAAELRTLMRARVGRMQSHGKLMGATLDELKLCGALMNVQYSVQCAC